MQNRTFYRIRPRLYREADEQAKVRISPSERRILKATLKEHFKRGEMTKFKTEKDGLDALNHAGLSLDDYSVNETASLDLGWPQR